MSEPVSLDDVRSIIKLVQDADNVAEFTLKYGDLEISISRESRAGVNTSAPAIEPAPALPPGPATEPKVTSGTLASVGVPAPQADEVVITAPMVGTLYRAPEPGEPPFVEIGKRVERDSVLCIIEVMKLMNSLEAGVEGTVTRILVEDSQVVEYGQALIYIRKTG